MTEGVLGVRQTDWVWLVVGLLFGRGLSGSSIGEICAGLYSVEMQALVLSQASANPCSSREIVARLNDFLRLTSRSWVLSDSE